MRFEPGVLWNFSREVVIEVADSCAGIQQRKQSGPIHVEGNVKHRDLDARSALAIGMSIYGQLVEFGP